MFNSPNVLRLSIKCQISGNELKKDLPPEYFVYFKLNTVLFIN